MKNIRSVVSLLSELFSENLSLLIGFELIGLLYVTDVFSASMDAEFCESYDQGMLANGYQIPFADDPSVDSFLIYKCSIGAFKIFNYVVILFSYYPGVSAGDCDVVNLQLVVAVSSDGDFLLIGFKLFYYGTVELHDQFDHYLPPQI